MVFTVSCPECSSEFPVDSAKVPREGVYARCNLCPGVFLVERPAGTRAADADDPGDVALSHDASDGRASAGAVADGAEKGASRSTGGPVAEEAPQDPHAAPAAVAEPRRFGQSDPDARAARLARVLVSDMITYNPAMYEKAVARGTLAEDFEDEVKRSWSEYVEQVGEDLARSTPHFTRALNDILAKGEDLFEDSMYE